MVMGLLVDFLGALISMQTFWQYRTVQKNWHYS